MKILITFKLFFVLSFISNQLFAQESTQSNSGDSYFFSISAKESTDGNAHFTLNRSNGDDEALVKFNLGAVGDPDFSTSHTWEIGLNDNDNLSIFRHRVPLIGSPAVYNAIVISDDANNDGAEDDPEVNIPSIAQLSFGEPAGLFQPGFLTSHPTLGSTIQVGALSFLPSIDALTSLGGNTNRFAALWAVDGTINTSDGRLKKNIKTINYGLNDLMRLRPVAYNWKDAQSPENQIGLIAQEVLKVVPEAVVDSEVTFNEEGKKVVMPVENMGIKYAALIPVLISSIQEQQEIIESLKKRIAEIESK